MKLYTAFLLLILFTFYSCKSIQPDRPPQPTVENVLPNTPSRINIPITIPLSFIENQLNQANASKLFADRGVSLGSGLFADLDVNRIGKIVLKSTSNNMLSIQVPMNLQGDLKIEKRVFGQNLSTNFPFNENLSPVVNFKPTLNQNYNLGIENLEVEDWGRRMKYNLLGFEIDLDQLAKRQLKNVLDNQLSSGALEQLDFKKMVQETWDAFGQPYTVEQNDLKAHFYSIPTAIKVSEEITSDQNFVIYLGLEGNMQSKIGEKPSVITRPLPPLQPNESTENIIDLHLPLHIPYAELDNLLMENFDDQQIRADRNTVIIPKNIKTQQYGDKTLLSMDFRAVRENKKDVTGQLFLAGKPEFDMETETLRFADLQFDVKTANPFTRLGILSKRRKILKQVEKLAAYPLGSFLAEARIEIKQMGKVDTNFAEFLVTNPDLTIEGIYPDENAITILLQATGSTTMKLKIK